MPVGWHHLGADFPQQANHDPSLEIAEVIGVKTPIFMTVSTLEPRNGYPIALDAFEEVWDSGLDACYVIVGRHGWKSGRLAHRIVTHPEYGKRLFWFQSLSDADLILLYGAARAFVFPSIAEGFGLGLIEAAHYGLPVIASDIDVFREIGGEAVDFFEVGNAFHLSELIRKAIQSEKKPPAIPFLTWRESADGIFSMIRNNSYQTRIAPQLVASDG